MSDAAMADIKRFAEQVGPRAKGDVKLFEQWVRAYMAQSPGYDNLNHDVYYKEAAKLADLEDKLVVVPKAAQDVARRLSQEMMERRQNGPAGSPGSLGDSNTNNSTGVQNLSGPMKTMGLDE